ncbi:MAG: 16S rRNA (guanine(527)-N(7))-methyltransferase RsmG [Dehalococcoidia bacterium]
MGVNETREVTSALPVLQAIAQRLDVALPDGAIEAFDRYHRLLAGYGGRFNLTAVLDADGVQRRHFGEALALGAALSDAGLLHADDAVIDIGSGAGFPGLPLKIAWPSLRLALLEATGKKARFLQTVVDELGVTGVQIVQSRAEDAGHSPTLRERFDLVVARAVAPLATLAELTLPFARVGGYVAAIKGSRILAELVEAGAAIAACGGGAPRVVALPGGNGDVRLQLVLIEKQAVTPLSLPRAAGVPNARPLR